MTTTTRSARATYTFRPAVRIAPLETLPWNRFLFLTFVFFSSLSAQDGAPLWVLDSFPRNRPRVYAGEVPAAQR